MVEIIKPVFLIIWAYLSVYPKEIRRINTSTKIRIVKKSTKKIELIFWVKYSFISNFCDQLIRFEKHRIIKMGTKTILNAFLYAINFDKSFVSFLLGIILIVFLMGSNYYKR